MASPDVFSRIPRLFHFTDSRNHSSIRKVGALYSTAKLRELTTTTNHPGGNQWSLDADVRSGMDKYVHLCFKGKHPMQYLASKDGRIEKTTWLVIKPTVLKLEGVLFCPGVANKTNMMMVPIAEAGSLIDFEVLYRHTDWSDPAIRARLHAAEKAEILVPDRIPVEFIESHYQHG